MQPEIATTFPGSVPFMKRGPQNMPTHMRNQRSPIPTFALAIVDPPAR